MGGIKKKDNHYLHDKVKLRIDYSPWPKDPEEGLKVLDAYGGFGVVWKSVQRISGSKVIRSVIDERRDLVDFHMHGDNLKVMSSIDLNAYDVIDLDAYGMPVEQIKLVAESGFSGVVFVTFIRIMGGAPPQALFEDLGFPLVAYKKCPTLISRRTFQYFLQWLASLNVKKLVHRSSKNKHYLAFRLNGADLF